MTPGTTIWSDLPASNRRQLTWKDSALPAELRSPGSGLLPRIAAVGYPVTPNPNGRARPGAAGVCVVRCRRQQSRLGWRRAFSLQPAALHAGIGAFIATTFTSSNRSIPSPLGITALRRARSTAVAQRARPDPYLSRTLLNAASIPEAGPFKLSLESAACAQYLAGRTPLDP